MIKPPANRLPPTLAAVLMGIIFLSGMAGLTYEVLWLRQLNLIFGVTAFALSVTLAAFMGGLALGSYLFGRLADRLKAPLLVYAALEAGIGIYALMAGPLFSGLDSIYITAGRALGFQHPLIEVFKTVGAFLIILLPTTLMGGTLPVLSKVFVRREEDLGLKVSMLYALNTFGALVGTFLTGFFLIRSLGMAHTTYLAAAVNLLVALAAGLLSRLLATPEAGRPEAASPPVKVAAERIRLQRLVLGAMALSGFTALCYEVLWTRALVYFLGLTTYAFTTMLTAFLLGLAAGSLIMSRFIDRFKDHLAWLAATQLMIALGALALMPAINLLHPAGQALGELLGRESWWAVVGIRFLIALALMLPATLCLGATFPLAVRYYTANLKVLGSGIGRIYAFNTLGAVLGALAAGYLLIPLLGVRLSISLVVILNLAIAAALFYLNPALTPHRRRLTAGLAIVPVVLVALMADSRPLILSSVEFKGQQRRYKLLHASESADGSLAVLEDLVNGERELNINGESTAFTIYQDMQVHKLLGHLAPLFHPAPTDFLVVGFGLGSTAYASTLYPDARVDCVELVADEVTTAPYFERQNHDVLNHPSFNLIIGDGRDYIKLTDRRYDIISFNAIHPKISPNLYTQDFYRYCRRLLKEDGLIVAWMPPNAISAQEFWSLARTFQSVFPYSSLWYVNPSHLLILGSANPVFFDWKLLNSRLADAAIRADLAETNLENPYELLSNFVVADEALAELVAAAPINSDNHPAIEFSQVYRVNVNVEALNILRRAKREVLPYLVNVGGPEALAAVRDSLAHYERLKAQIVEGQIRAWLGLYDDAERAYRRVLAAHPGHPHALYLLRLIERRQVDLEKLVALNPRNNRALKALADSYLVDNRLEEARELFQRAVAIDPQQADALHGLGVLEYQHDRLGQARQAFSQALAVDPQYSPAHFYSGLVSWRMGNATLALDHFRLAADLDPARAVHHYWLGLSLTKVGRTAEARQALQLALDLDPSLEPARQALTKLEP